MIRFTEHLTEAFKVKSGKNVHLEHLEDEILNDGYAGFTRAVSAVRGVLDVFAANEPSAYDITVKWDGAPAIVCGIDPSSGRFFVGTKSENKRVVLAVSNWRSTISSPITNANGDSLVPPRAQTLTFHGVTLEIASHEKSGRIKSP